MNHRRQTREAGRNRIRGVQTSFRLRYTASHCTVQIQSEHQQGVHQFDRSGQTLREGQLKMQDRPTSWNSTSTPTLYRLHLMCVLESAYRCREERLHEEIQEEAQHRHRGRESNVSKISEYITPVLSKTKLCIL